MPDPIEPFTVGQLAATAIEAFFSAAALHLGEALPDGRKLDATDPMEAWRAILGASALINQLGPLMIDARLMPYQAGLDHLLAEIARRHPTMEFPMPAWVADAVHRVQAELPPGAVQEALRQGLNLPTRPSAGLPTARREGGGPLFPR